MTYSTDEKNEAAQWLCHYLPGLRFRVARAWVTAEQGLNCNTFGVTVGGVLKRYPTLRVGARAAATRVMTSKMYAGIVASLAGADADVQARAVVSSPWRLGPSGLKAAGGVDPYYRRIFRLNGFRAL